MGARSGSWKQPSLAPARNTRKRCCDRSHDPGMHRGKGASGEGSAEDAAAAGDCGRVRWGEPRSKAETCPPLDRGLLHVKARFSLSLPRELAEAGQPVFRLREQLLNAHRSTKCIRRRGVGWRAAGRREEKHGQPVPKVERWGGRTRIGTPAPVSTWHSYIRPESPLQASGRGGARGSARRTRDGAWSTSASQSVLKEETDLSRLGEPSPAPCWFAYRLSG